jgi:hypothetical protein
LFEVLPTGRLSSEIWLATQTVSRFSQQFIRLNWHNRSSRLRRVIFMHRGSLKDHVRLEDKSNAIGPPTRNPVTQNGRCLRKKA